MPPPVSRRDLLKGSIVWTFSFGTTGMLLRSAAAQDAVNLLSYQGRLTDSSGWPLSGMYNVSFQMVNQSGSGLPSGSPWKEGHPNVPVEDGVFTLLLGSQNSFPIGIFEGPPMDSSGQFRMFSSIDNAMAGSSPSKSFNLQTGYGAGYATVPANYSIPVYDRRALWLLALAVMTAAFAHLRAGANRPF